MYHVEDITRTRDVLNKHLVEYMFVGKGAAIMQGFSDTTQDIDIYPKNDSGNNERLVNALREIGFEIIGEKEKEILRGKDFIQLRKPFEMDVVFAPDGFESYDEAVKFKLIHDGFPVMTIEGILRTKKAAGRLKDRESMIRLRSFKDYLDAKKRSR